MKYYAVKIGRKPGIYSSWAECKKQVDKFPNAKFKSFDNRKDAKKFIETVSEYQIKRQEYERQKYSEASNIEFDWSSLTVTDEEVMKLLEDEDTEDIGWCIYNLKK